MLPTVLKSLRQTARSRVTGFHRSRTGFRASHLLHWLIWIAATIPHRRGHGSEQRRGVVVVCPPGGGNIGDQALVESAAWNSDSPVVLVVRSPDNYEIPEWLAQRDVSTIALPNLLYGLRFSHYRDVWRFFSLSRHARSVTIIGADIMDGRYSPAASVNRWSLAILAGRSGAATSVLGFSWNATPANSSVVGMVKADRQASLWVRDPVSLDRMRALGASAAQMCADIVFVHPARGLDTGARTLPASVVDALTPRYAIVNASGYIGSNQHVMDQYRTTIRALLDSGLTVVLLPHVMRGFSDLDCLADLHRELPECVLIDSLLTPAQVSELASGAEIVVTGRMHLAVLSALVGTPVLTLATQGKVDGLYRLLDRPDWVLDSSRAFSEQVLSALSEVTAGAADFPSERALNELKRLAGLPFA